LNDPKKKEELTTCEKCGDKVPKSKCFVNKKCKHTYCMACIKKIKSYETSCPIRMCYDVLDKQGVQLFIELEFSKSSKISLPDDSGRGNSQSFPTESKPIKNLIQSIDNGNKDLTSSRVGTNKIIPEIKHNNRIEIERPKEREELTTCEKCRDKVPKSKCFVNKKCKHTYCVECTRKIKSYDSSCPLRTCYDQLDKQGIHLFLEKVLLAESKEDTYMTVKCKFCDHENSVPKPKNSTVDYLKCTKCTRLLCGEHGDLMEKCMCLCPQCVSSIVYKVGFQEKLCKKCKKRTCLTCGSISNDINKSCPCKCELCFGKKEVMEKRLCLQCQDNSNICHGCREEGDLLSIVRLHCNHQVCQRCIYEMVTEKFSPRLKKEEPRLIVCPVCINSVPLN